MLSVSEGSRCEERLFLDLGVICESEDPGRGLDSLAGDDFLPEASLMTEFPAAGFNASSSA